MCCCCCCSDCCCTVLLCICAIIFPPFPVLLECGFYSTDFLLNCLLTLLGYIPGLVHSLIIIFSRNHRNEREYRLFYQQGWLERGNLVPRDVNNGGSTSPPTNIYVQHTINEIPIISEPNQETPLMPKGAPPPYQELV
ncbi:Sna4p SCDLUD_000310 [Saccharomycodes ludwigii]|uniref:Sna4p n=1 Tax=Saccharomycodes ludwigii TaxID=36035 RepID=UPI001E887D64|nr:hypothetical protein SCDLUD_000310 [Saccharomycodes ludwigii]KAH3902724.1 hypothetical protein SCDLUD_000310 [Saccharomycodes ludwigii]